MGFVKEMPLYKVTWGGIHNTTLILVCFYHHSCLSSFSVAEIMHIMFLSLSFLISCRWEDNIKMDLQEVGRGCGDWMELDQDKDRCRALVSTVMNFRVP